LNSSKIGVDYAVARAIERSRARFEGVRSAFERSVAVRVDGRRTVGRCVGGTIYPLRARGVCDGGNAVRNGSESYQTSNGRSERLGIASNVAA